MKITQSTMKKAVESYIGTERTSKAALAKLSRDLLTYVYDDFGTENRCNDTPMINRLLEGLTPANKRVACQFFAQYIGWEFDKDNLKFGKKLKTKMYDKYLDKAQEALKDTAFNMWSWYEAKGDKPEKKDKDHKKAVGQAIKAALTEEGDNKLSIVDIAMILYAQNVDLRTLLSAVDKLAAVQELEA